MTRARQRLFLSYAVTRYLHGKRSYTRGSRFLKEAGLNVPTKPKPDDVFEYKDQVYQFTKSLYMPNVFSTVKKENYVTNNSIIGEKKDVSMYKVGQKVSHPKFGIGKIVDIVDDGECVDILFDNFGKKTLILEIAPLEIID